MIRLYSSSDYDSIDLIGSQIKENFNNIYGIRNLNNTYANIIVYEDNNKILGFLHFEEHFEVTDIINIAVAYESQNKGIGELLINYLINNTSGNKIMLEVRENNVRAIGLYNKCGFKEINRRKNYYGNEDAIIMEREV